MEKIFVDLINAPLKYVGKIIRINILLNPFFIKLAYIYNDIIHQKSNDDHELSRDFCTTKNNVLSFSIPMYIWFTRYICHVGKRQGFSTKSINRTNKLTCRNH